MENLFDTSLFVVGDNQFRWADVALAAKARGDWRELDEQLRQGLACLKRAKLEGSTIPPHDITAAANQYRYERHLITGEETEAWLSARRLTVRDWMGYIHRSLLRQKWADELPETVSRCWVADAEINQALNAEAVCSGHLARFSRTLAGRAAVYEKFLELAEENGWPIDDDRVQSHLEVFSRNVNAQADAGVAIQSLQKKLEELARMEAAFEAMAGQAVTGAALKSCIAANRIDWIKLDLEYVAFDNQNEASEGALCIREDSMTLAEMAANAKRPLQRASLYVNELDPELVSSFLGCARHELLGPLNWNGIYTLFWVADKTIPSESDSLIKQKARESILGTLAKREINDRVRWNLILD